MMLLSFEVPLAASLVALVWGAGVCGEQGKKEKTDTGRSTLLCCIFDGLRRHAAPDAWFFMFRLFCT